MEILRVYYDPSQFLVEISKCNYRALPQESRS